MTRALLPYLFILPSFAYSLVTLYSVRSFFSRRTKSEKISPPLSIVKPIKGLDAGSRRNLESFCLQDYPEFQIVFALQSQDDPSLPVIRQLIVDYPDLDMKVVIDGTVHGSNAKVGNLINAYQHLKHDIIVVSDSDIRVAPDYLSNITAHFSDPKAGLVTSVYRAANVDTLSAAIEATGYCSEMIPNVIVAERLEGLSFALGASMAVRRDALQGVGGFGALADYLADDYQLGNMIHRAGWKVALSGDFVDIYMQRESLSDVLSRQLRWSRTMRVSRPRGYLASGITHPIPALALSVAFAGLTFPALSAAALLYMLRSSVLTFLSRSYAKDGLFPRYLWLLPFRDLLSTATWALAFAGNRVRWRGELYTVGSDGKMARRG